jgi:hypothetical protein
MAIDINIESQVSQTITDGVTTKAPSENAVFDALALKIGGAVSIGQVAFGTATGVIGGDAGLTWDNTNKRLGVNTNIPTRTLDVNGITRFRNFIGIDSSNEDSRSLFFTNGDNLGTMSSGRLRASELSFWNSAVHVMNIKSNSVGIGLPSGDTPTARLHVQSQGALSTDIAFRVMNSTGTLALFEHKGDGFFDFVNNANTARLRWLNQNTFQFRFVGQFNLANDLGAINITALSNISLSSQGSNLTMNQAGCVSIGGAPVGLTAGTGVNSLLIANGTAPSANIVNRHYYYSADITEGNAAPHFRTENGSVIKLYKQDLPTNPTNAQIATFLSNLGLANLI